MANLKFPQLGWVLFAATAAVLMASGFQDTSTKIAVVDLSKVVEDSAFGKKNQDAFAQMKASREEVLDFIDTYRVLTPEQATRIRDLNLKVNPSPAEKSELESKKAEVIASSKKFNELSTKPNMTPEDRTLVEDYARRSQMMDGTAQRWFREFTNEMQSWADKQKLDSVEKARAAINEVAKAGGYTVVFEVGIAPYGANDLTAAALQAMNAKNP
jgi:Skp family chaperone for outer membrane proteins